jgi:PAS domain S-box-containing protein
MLCTTTKRILFVDDDKSVLAAAKRQLKSSFEVTTADDPRKAMELFRRSGPFPVVVSDLEMAGMSGVEFLTQARQMYPQTVCIMMTGHTDLNVGVEATNKGLVFRFLSKSCGVEKLTEAIEEAFAQHERLMSVGRYTYSVQVADGQPARTEYNENCALVTGYTTEEFEENDLLWISIVMPEFRTAVVEFGSSVLSAHRSGCIEYQIRRKDGQVRWMRDTIIMHFDGDDKLSRYDGLIEDITEERKAQADLREKMRLNRVLVDALPCRAMLVDKRTNEIVVANEMSLMAGGVPGRKCFASWDGSEGSCAWCQSKEMARRGETIRMEFSKDGQWWQVHWVPVTNELFLHYMLDVTEHKESQDKLREANEKLGMQEKLIGEFAEKVSGELRTPLFAVKDIISNALAGKMGEMDNRLKDGLRVADSKVERLAKVINEQLDARKNGQ